VILAGCSDDAGEVSVASTSSTAADATITTAAPIETTTASTTTVAPQPTTTTALPTPNLDVVNPALEEIAELDEPVSMTFRPQAPDVIYIAERPGRVRVMRNGDVADDPVLDIADLTDAQGEQGLLGIAAHPTDALLYANYTDNSGDTQIVEFTIADDGSIDGDSRREVLSIEQPYGNHNGGGLVFGPDGLLWIGTGDGGSGGDPERRATNPESLLGKMLRIDPRASGDAPYSVPDDNPFVNDGAYAPEIFSTGLRNPWRYSFDRVTGDLWIADVGQNEVEEIHLADAAAGAGRGQFYGWSAFEGNERFNSDVSPDGALPPVHTYPHGEQGCSITGGYVYRGSALPNLRGAYIFADYCTPGVRAFDGTNDVMLDESPTTVVSFGEDADGELYVMSLNGPVYKLVHA
jgi:glucose/arabinose dehydrogenase